MLEFNISRIVYTIGMILVLAIVIKALSENFSDWSQIFENMSSKRIIKM